MNAVATMHKTHTFKWLLKREFWENRGGFFWAPVITGGIVAVLYSLLAVIGSIAGRKAAGGYNLSIDEAPEKVAQALGVYGDGVLMGGVLLTCSVLAFVVFFYALGSLYDDRRDRSVLFWKSLPVSDASTVLSKLAWALLLAPLIAFVVGVALGLVLWVVSALTLTVNGLPAGTAVFTRSHPLRVIGGVLGSLPVYVLWALPTVGWLMFCSAWARSKPFLWAVLVPVLGCVIVSMMGILPGMEIPHDRIWYIVAFRGLLSVVPGMWYLNPAIRGEAPKVNDLDDLSGTIGYTHSWQAFATADLWIGAIVGAALIAAAIYLRRWRELAD
ncbi:MAG: ABC transporter permease [Pseudoxanthomonas sp.]